MRLMAAAATSRWAMVMSEKAATTVLVVDEEPQILQVVRVVLDREGYRVLSARSLREALRLAQQHPGAIRVLLVDAMLPQLDYPEALRQFAANQPHLRTVIMSDTQITPPAGAHLLVKPFTPQSLIEVVRTALQAGSRGVGAA